MLWWMRVRQQKRWGKIMGVSIEFGGGGCFVQREVKRRLVAMAAFNLQ